MQSKSKAESKKRKAKMKKMGKKMEEVKSPPSSPAEETRIPQG